ncbi:hypothetical protein [Thermaerobacillus caldiproteolyticus]|uniref:hypothetical protein n=1 Tax=Thermaerobacillus caldiproteolyticus TaxID=247480 RepID=UPI0018F1946F|nr:hypothetical protein [Anoxybacillus caldiproteolyticus]
MNPIDISFSSDPFDQWRLSQVGGQITFNKSDKPVFRFNDKQQYDKYLKLNEHRQNFMKRKVR